MADSFDKFSDPFAPPRANCTVCCIHCGSTYDSWRIVWRDMPGEAIAGAWCCPIPGCDGIGFGFDIHPVDSGADEVDESDDDIDFEEAEEDFLDSFEDDDFEVEDGPPLPIDVFDDDALWIDPRKVAPRLHGNTPQPPYGRAPHGSSSSSDGSFKDDDIPF